MSNEISRIDENHAEPWQRLWLPADTWDRMRGIDADFLTDYGGQGGVGHAFENSLPGIGLLEEFRDVPFLNLLGRPGSGKSWELRLAAESGCLGERSVFVEGKAFGATNAAIYLQSVLGGQLTEPCRLIIDGLDEILLANPQFLAELKGWIRLNTDPHGRPRHSLAISCRWADWPESQIAELAALWSAENSKTLILAPLRRSEAAETLKRRFGDDDAEVFWRQMGTLHVQPIACWPQGFLALLDQFETSGCRSIAASHADLIVGQVKKLSRLADLPDDALRWQFSVKGTEWRRRIAGRIAATMIVSGRAQLALEETSGPSNQVFLAADDLGHSDEIWEGQRILPKLEDLDAVVHCTRLMRRLPGTGRWVFDSQVHQEWLAARWFSDSSLDVARLRQIFGVISDGQWTVAPPMRATAAWLARLDPEFRDLVLQNDPLTLLRMDGACLPDREREEIVEALFVATESARVLDPAVRHAHFPSLKHSGLIEQLERWLTRPDACDATRHLAIELAEKTELCEISDVLWRIYPDAGKVLRSDIAGALFRLAKRGHEEKWRSVLEGGIPIDAHGTLLGAALQIMVIDHGIVPVREVVNRILPSRRFEAFGLFDTVSRDLHEHLTAEDLTAVFRKLSEDPRSIRNSRSRAQAFSDSALSIATAEIGRTEIESAFIEYWHACLRHHVVPKRNLAEFDDNSDARRKLVRGLVSHPGFERHREQGWVCAADYLVDDRDFEWCLAQLETASPEHEWRYAMLAATMVWRVDLNGHQGTMLDAACQKCQTLRGMLPETQEGESVSLAIIRLAAEKKSALDAKNKHSDMRQEQRERARRQRIANEIEQCRVAHDQGQPVWPRAFRILMFRRSFDALGIVSFSPISDMGPDDEWMKEAAARFITEAPKDPQFGSEFGLYGLLALAACADRLDSDDRLRDSIRKEWLVHLIPRLCNHGMGDPPAGISNERFAAEFPADFTQAFGRFCRDSYCKDGSLSELHQIEEIGLADLVPELKAVLLEEPVRAAGFFTGMWFLSRKDADAAIEVALRWLPELSGDLPPDVAASVYGSAAILVSGRLTAEIEPHLSDKTRVSNAVRAAASRLSWTDREFDFTEWSDHALTVLGDAIWKVFPDPDRHRKHRGTFEFHGVTDEDQAMEFRDRLSSAAWSRGIDLAIPEAVEGESDEDAGMRRHMIDWHRHTNRQTRAAGGWKAFEPAAFLKLADRPNARLARDPGELLEAVMESLGRWEKRMENQGTWDHLWNSRESKPEKRIAREMRDWLLDDLEILVEREIELASNDRADILVQTIPTDGLRQITVVIELKKHRSNNAKERRSSMKSQLVDRYLRERLDEGWTHGLYVVAWTPTPGSQADSAKAIEKARAELALQAAVLSVPPFSVKSMVIDARYRG